MICASWENYFYLLAVLLLTIVYAFSCKRQIIHLEKTNDELERENDSLFDEISKLKLPDLGEGTK